MADDVELRAEDFELAELGAAWLEVWDQTRANSQAVAAELRTHQASPYVAPDDRRSIEGQLAAKLARLQDDEIALGRVIDVARHDRARAEAARS